MTTFVFVFAIVTRELVCRTKINAIEDDFIILYECTIGFLSARYSKTFKLDILSAGYSDFIYFIISIYLFCSNFLFCYFYNFQHLGVVANMVAVKYSSVARGGGGL